MILPDGSVYSGFAEADRLIKMIDEASAKTPKKKKDSSTTHRPTRGACPDLFGACGNDIKKDSRW